MDVKILSIDTIGLSVRAANALSLNDFVSRLKLSERGCSGMAWCACICVELS